LNLRLPSPESGRISQHYDYTANIFARKLDLGTKNASVDGQTGWAVLKDLPRPGRRAPERCRSPIIKPYRDGFLLARQDFRFGHMIGDGQVSACGSEVTDVLERNESGTGYRAVSETLLFLGAG
jgi:hypothetical protein